VPPVIIDLIDLIDHEFLGIRAHIHEHSDETFSAITTGVFGIATVFIPEMFRQICSINNLIKLFGIKVVDEVHEIDGRVR